MQSPQLFKYSGFIHAFLLVCLRSIFERITWLSLGLGTPKSNILVRNSGRAVASWLRAARRCLEPRVFRLRHTRVARCFIVEFITVPG